MNFQLKIRVICPYNLYNTVIPTIFHEERKFLGKVLFPLEKSKDTFIYLKSEIIFKRLVVY